MMECTERNYRFLARLISTRTLLYTEMVVCDDLVLKRNTADSLGEEILLGCSKEESPLALQLGGADPELLGKATDIAAGRCDLSEINLNCGCPSNRVTGCLPAKQFGAVLMHKADIVKECVHEMSRRAGNVPITVKCRLGTDEVNGYESLCDFVRTVSEGGVVKTFGIHARECVLAGLTPKENRSVPPLRPRWAHQLQRDFPHLRFVMNGQVKSIQQALTHLSPTLRDADADPVPAPPAYGSYEGVCTGEDGQFYGAPTEHYHWEDLPPVAGVMIGREAWYRPWLLSDVDTRVYGERRNNGRSRRDVLDEYVDYSERMQAEYDSMGRDYLGRNFMNPLIGLFAREPGGREWRRQLDKEWVGKGILGRREPSLRDMVEAAKTVVPDAVLDEKGGEDLDIPGRRAFR